MVKFFYSYKIPTFFNNESKLRICWSYCNYIFVIYVYCLKLEIVMTLTFLIENIIINLLKNIRFEILFIKLICALCHPIAQRVRASQRVSIYKGEKEEG